VVDFRPAREWDIPLIIYWFTPRICAKITNGIWISEEYNSGGGVLGVEIFYCFHLNLPVAVGDVCGEWVLKVSLVRTASLHADVREAGVSHEGSFEEFLDAGEGECYYRNPSGW